MKTAPLGALACALVVVPVATAGITVTSDNRVIEVEASVAGTTDGPFSQSPVAPGAPFDRSIIAGVLGGGSASASANQDSYVRDLVIVASGGANAGAVSTTNAASATSLSLFEIEFTLDDTFDAALLASISDSGSGVAEFELSDANGVLASGSGGAFLTLGPGSYTIRASAGGTTDQDTPGVAAAYSIRLDLPSPGVLALGLPAAWAGARRRRPGGDRA